MKEKKVSLRSYFSLLFYVALFVLILLVGFAIRSRMRQSPNPSFDLLVKNMKTDSNTEIRGISAIALGKMGNKKAFAYLMEAYEEDITIRREVIRALNILGISASELANIYDVDEPISLNKVGRNTLKTIVANIKRDIHQFDYRSYLMVSGATSLFLGSLAYFVSGVLAHAFGRHLSQRVRLSIGVIVILTFMATSLWIRYSSDSTVSANVRPETVEMVMIDISVIDKDEKMIPTLIQILINPNKPTEIRCKAAEALGQIGKEEAVSALREVVGSPTDDKEVRTFAIWAIGNISASEENYQEEFDYRDFLMGTIEEYDNILTRNPRDPYAHLDRGIVQTELGNYEIAITDFNKSIMYKPNLTEAYYRRGIAYHLKGSDLQKAIDDFTKAINQDAEKAEVYCHRGLVYQERKQLREALNDFRNCALLQPEKADTHFHLGYVYRELNQNNQAITEFQEYLRLYPQAPDASEVREWIQKLSNQ